MLESCNDDYVLEDHQFLNKIWDEVYIINSKDEIRDIIKCEFNMLNDILVKLLQIMVSKIS